MLVLIQDHTCACIKHRTKKRREKYRKLTKRSRKPETQKVILCGLHVTIFRILEFQKQILLPRHTKKRKETLHTIKLLLQLSWKTIHQMKLKNGYCVQVNSKLASYLTMLEVSELEGMRVLDIKTHRWCQNKKGSLTAILSTERM